jgi:hypothetical protein
MKRRAFQFAGRPLLRAMRGMEAAQGAGDPARPFQARLAKGRHPWGRDPLEFDPIA